MKKIKDLERTEKERVVVYSVDVLNYRSIVDALKGCCGLFCCLDSPDGYDVSLFSLSYYYYFLMYTVLVPWFQLSLLIPWDKTKSIKPRSH